MQIQLLRLSMNIAIYKEEQSKKMWKIMKGKRKQQDDKHNDEEGNTYFPWQFYYTRFWKFSGQYIAFQYFVRNYKTVIVNFSVRTFYVINIAPKGYLKISKKKVR